MTDPAPLILLVDDEPDIRTLYEAALTRQGFRVVTAENGAKAIEVAKREHPALILMDMKMPVMDGVEAAVNIHEDPETAKIKLVFLTAFSDPNRPATDIQAAKDIGALDFVKKGISLKELGEKVNKYLKQ